MLTRPTIVALTTPLLLVGAGCGDTESTLTVDASVTLCPDQGPCSTLAASGASVEIRAGDGSLIKRGVLDQRGSLEMTVDADRYSARVELAGLKAVDGSMTISQGESGQLSLMLSANIESDQD